MVSWVSELEGQFVTVGVIFLLTHVTLSLSIGNGMNS